MLHATKQITLDNHFQMPKIWFSTLFLIGPIDSAYLPIKSISQQSIDKLYNDVLFASVLLQFVTCVSIIFQVVFDETLQQCLDSYLHQAPR